jgi:protein phosphatase
LVDNALGLFAVADGMGAMTTGRPAADLALAALREHYFQASSEGEGARLVSAVRAANSALFARTGAASRQWEGQQQGKLAADRDITRWLGMGSTLVAVRIADRQALLAHVGDSRAYRYHRGELVQLTTDHRLVEEARRAGMPESEVAKLPARVITRALGMHQEVEVESQAVAAEPGDLFLLASDGLTDVLPPTDLGALLRLHAADLDAAAAALVERAAAQRQGAPLGDNITVIVLRIEG